jgi:beta-N-acetylhexosaminidase
MENLGQLIITGIDGITLKKEEQQFLEEENIGGVILFTKNYESPAQLAELVNSIQKCRKEFPLFIGVDHEGGRVIRFKTHFTQWPSMLALASLNSPKLVFEVHEIMAEELKACGINLNFGPVCDVFTNPQNKVIGDRAFAKDPDSVGKFVTSAIRGMQTKGVMACAKHFPGHGNTTKDSHFDLPVVKRSIAELEEIEIPPFIKAVKARVEMVMMAHLIVDSIDPHLPTSLSPAAHVFLREKLKYNRIIISDDMQMKAITDHYTVENAAVMAIKAGADIIEYRDMSFSREALLGLKQAVKLKEISQELIQEKIDRIHTAKKEYLKDYNPVYIPALTSKINSKNTQLLLDEIGRRLAEPSVQH